jgi:hypothetical protein
VGLFTLAKHAPVAPNEEKFEKTRGTAYGSGLIHIHSKLVIADDQACLLSSANINGRSFQWDTELGFLWHEPGGVIADFRKGLWSQLFGGAECRRVWKAGGTLPGSTSMLPRTSAKALFFPTSSAARAVSGGHIGSSPTISSETRKGATGW